MPKSYMGIIDNKTNKKSYFYIVTSNSKITFEKTKGKINIFI